jgi:GT2 family glycosyltransferase
METRPKLLICLPGNPDQSEWIANWSLLLLYLAGQHLAGRFELELRWFTGTNIYTVRQFFAEEAERLKPDYVLWIDSDNVPTVEAFEGLYNVMVLDQNRGIGILGAWYYYATKQGIKIAAAHWSHWKPGAIPVQVTEADIEAAAPEPFEVGWIGFGFCLMRGEIFQHTGPWHFRPIHDDAMPGGFMTDDVGFCYLASLHGFKTYLHPGVRVEHLKVLKVPPPEKQQELATLAVGEGRA